MKHIFNKTYSKMFTYVTMPIVVAASLFAGYLLAGDYLDVMTRTPTFVYLSQRLAVMYCMLTFVLIAGLCIWMIVANTSSGLFANELHEGTLRLLLSKPVSRYELVVGKIGGMLAGAMTYLGISLLIVLGIFTLRAQPDQDILIYLLKYTFVFLLYGTFVILIAGAIGNFLSTCFKKKVPALLILALIGFLIFGIIPIARTITQSLGVYDKMHLYLFDLNYQFGLIFNSFTQLIGQLSSSSGQIEVYNVFTNLFKNVPTDVDVTLTSGSLMVLNKTLNNVIVVGGYGLLTAVLYVLSFRRMKLKDIS